MDLSVISVDPNTGVVSFKLSPRPVSDIDKLIQMIVLSLLSSPESDLLDPQGGGGLNDLIGGTNIDSNDLSELYTEVSRRVVATEKEVINNQIGLDVTSEEKLRRIEIVSLESAAEGEVSLRLRVENEVGRTRDIVI